MNHPQPASFVRMAVLTAVVALSLICGAFAKDSARNFLPVDQPDAATLLPPPPLPSSPEQAADMAEVHAIYHAAGSNDMAAAYAEKKFDVFSFAEAAGPFFVQTNLPKTAAFFEKVRSDAAIATDTGKDHFQRPRPFTTDPSLANGKLEKSFSYPSGHSTESMVIALVLADLLPERHDQILARARQIGWHRVQIARHYPTDIYAGRVFALAIVKEFKKSADFQKEFAEAKAELDAVKR